MSLSRIDVEHVARLARLALTEDEKEKFRSQLDSILGYVEKLKSWDTTGVLPTAHPWLAEDAPLAADGWREDHTERLQGVERDELLKNAPEREGPFFKVKKIIES